MTRSRDTFDMFTPPDRGRFGDNESVRGNDSVRSDLVDVTLILRDERPLAIAVSQMQGAGAKWIWLPKSKIEFERKANNVVVVTLPGWMAKEKGLV